jgi:acyl dehydratase
MQVTEVRAMTLFFEDLSVGQAFRSQCRPVTAEEIKAFACAFDPQPFHLDELEAERTFFGGLAASGWHTAALTMLLLVQTVPLAGGIIGVTVDELRWLRPVRPGDALRIEAAVCEMQSGSRSRGLVKVRCATLDQHDQTVQMLVATLLVSKRANSN